MTKLYGDEAIRMMNKGERKVERVEVADDPWWGKRYEYRTTYAVDGVTYEATTDRDGWPVLTAVEG